MRATFRQRDPIQEIANADCIVVSKRIIETNLVAFREKKGFELPPFLVEQIFPVWWMDYVVKN